MILRSDFDYHLPAERIAQVPLDQRDQSRLLVLDKVTGHISHRHFFNLVEYLEPNDVLVLNNTRVSAQRLFGSRRGHNDSVETFLTDRVSDGLWKALVRPGRKLHPGTVIEYGDGLTAEVLESTDVRGGRLIQFSAPSPIEDAIFSHSSAPLPPYITTPLANDQRERYQTVYSRFEGSSAAPTAGLHFTETLLRSIMERGVQITSVTLHVGIGTFRPIETEDVHDHVMHSEHMEITDECADVVNNASGRVVAVGTTSCRALESAATEKGLVRSGTQDTALFVTPGYDFKIVDALVTNFHMPRSTLMLLVSALAGTDHIRAAYSEALEKEYRFLSFGDSMFIQ